MWYKQVLCCICITFVIIFRCHRRIDMTQDGFKKQSDAVRFMITESGKRKSELAKLTGLDRTNFYRWFDKPEIKINNSTAQLVAKSLGYTINRKNKKIYVTPHAHADHQKESKMISPHSRHLENTEYIVELQKEKIAQQEKELVLLKAQLNNPIQKHRFEEIEADMETEIQIKNIFSMKPMERVISKAEGHKAVADKLGLDPDDYYNHYLCVGKWYIHEKHPVDAIIEKQSLSELRNITYNLPAVLESIKFMVGAHYMAFPVIYTYKDNICPTICSVLIQYKNKPITIASKTVIVQST